MPVPIGRVNHLFVVTSVGQAQSGLNAKRSPTPARNLVHFLRQPAGPFVFLDQSPLAVYPGTTRLIPAFHGLLFDDVRTYCKVCVNIK
jgi:hypothetical protein